MLKTLLMSLIAGLLATSTMSSVAQQHYLVGILPVYDQTAEPLTDMLPDGIGILLFKHLRQSPLIEPILLSPGGLYDPNSTEWNREYAQRAHVDALLTSRLYKMTRLGPHKVRLKFSVQVMNVATGSVGPELTNDEVEVTTESIFSATSSALGGNSYISTQSSGFFRSPEDFEKQPLGKAAAKLADWTIAQLPAVLTAQSVQQTGPDPGPTPPTCKVNFRIRYVNKHAIAKGYTVFANDQDESSTVSDGIAAFTIPSGRLAMRVIIPDPPYGVPTQKLYQSSTYLSCTQEVRTLSLDLGSAGEGLVHWE